MRTVIVWAVRFLLLALGVIAVGTGLLLVPMAAEVAEGAPDVAYLHWPVLVLYELALACGLGVLGCIWILLGAVEQGTIFAGTQSRTVNLALVLLAIATALTAAVALLVVLAPEGQVVAFSAAMTAPVVLLTATLLLLVMRSLLRQATTMRDELDEVV